VPPFYTTKSHCRCDPIRVCLVYLPLLKWFEMSPACLLTLESDKFGAGDYVLLGLSQAARALTHILPVCMSSFVDSSCMFKHQHISVVDVFFC